MVETSQDTPESYEAQRECGDRQVSKLYLVGEGIFYTCPSLPLIFKPCECCEYEPPQYRDYQWIKKSYIKHIREPTGVACNPNCPVCYPGVNTQVRYGLMWVGRKFYTPESFIAEDKEAGVSKAIKQIPKGLVLGETWVMLAHPGGYVNKEDIVYSLAWNQWISTGVDKVPPDPEPKPPSYPAVFFAFIPQKVEMPIYESMATPEYLAQLEAKGITPVIIPDKYTAHRTRHRKVRTRKNIAKRAAEG